MTVLIKKNMVHIGRHPDSEGDPENEDQEEKNQPLPAFTAQNPYKSTKIQAERNQQSHPEDCEKVIIIAVKKQL
jgi:hypothetical protein